ncbi:Zinc finger C2H2 [Fasciola gigantica]|uniref:Zinc finger C2H2 n=1 Tax=Fasciola gigantica TaxID=46835 RepID=A0A504YU99_FASGI|nr:Zinc finger C2H2 [Fasciola gigantica]
MSSTLLDKRRLKDRNRNFNPRWEEEFAFINFAGRPLCLICNVALTHFKSCNLKRHYETHHKSFAIEYPPWSERRRKRLLALKISRTHQDIPLTTFDEGARLATEAGFVISQACAQNSRILSEGESCKQLVLDVVSILDPLNGKLRQLIDDIPLVRSSWLKSDGLEISSDTIMESAATLDLPAASDDSEPNSPRLGQLVDTQARRSLSQHIQDIEHASGCFICSACYANTTEMTSRTLFSCSDPVAFQLHLSTQHPRLTSLICVYCSLRVQSSQSVSHMTSHFFPTEMTNTADIFVCPAEPECSQHFTSTHSTSLQVHWNTHHTSTEGGEQHQQQFKCSHCKRCTFASLFDWAEHIQRYVCPLVHCGVPGCLVKSPSRSLLVDHVARKHTDSTEVTSTNISALIQETFEVLCSKSELLPNAYEQKPMDDSEPKPTQTTVTSNGNPGQSEPRFVFLLRCPHCALNTVRWQHFLLHAPTCPGAIKAGLTSYRCRIYWCSDCQAVSTEQNLVTEHVTHTHKSRAFVVREQIRIAMLDARSKPISCKTTASATFSDGNNSSICTAQSGLISSIPLLTSGFASRAVTSDHVSFTPTPQQPPSASSALSTAASETTLGESIMNLAALARPSRQHSLTLTNQTHLTAALPQALPAIPLAPSSITAISLMPPAQVSVSAGAPVSLFPSAVALKTLQELTSSASNSMNNLSASDAASAVAAMAAAALTGLAGFDVNASTITSVSSQTFPVTLTSIPSSLGLNSSKLMPAVATLVSPAQPTSVTSNGNCAGPVASVVPLVSFPGTTAITVTSSSISNSSNSASVAVEPITTPNSTQTTTTMVIANTSTTTTMKTASMTICTPTASVEPHHDPIKLMAEYQLDDGGDNDEDGDDDDNNDDEDDDRDHPEFTGRIGDDMVSFPFDEDKFRADLSTRIRSPVLDRLVVKMRQFSSYLVRILGKENHRRIPVCPECGKVFPYGLGDFKRHLLTVHLEVPREYLKECLRFTYLPKSEEKFQEVQEQLAMRQMRPRMLEPGRRRVPLPYSIAILRRLTGQLPVATREFLEQKMQLYSRLSVIVDTRGGYRRYKCNHCTYSSPHALADVRKHILGSHCGISTKHFRHCLQASRLDPVEFTLFSDDKLARLAKEFLHRRQGLETGKDESRSPSPTGSYDQNGGGNELSSSVSSNSTPSIAETRSHDTYVSRFTTMVPGSKNPVTVRIRPPVPPDNPAVNESSVASSSSIGSPVAGQSTAIGRCSPTPQSPPESPESEDEFQATTSVDHLDLATLPTIPGLEGADRVVDLPLPFSEAVLRKLLDSAGATESQTRDILSKMQVYSTYTMTRICRGDRTLAFRCPCGRLFVTTRQPDSGIRAATLADSRRHVMGVHARISHDVITICCQASRITRDYDFELYSDEMLLRLAMERPIKLNSTALSSANNSASVASSTLGTTSASGSGPNNKGTSFHHTHRPLKELAPYPPILPNLVRKSVSADTGIESGTDTRDSVHTPNSVAHRDQNDDSNEDRDASDPESSGARKPQKGLEDPLSHLTKAQASTTEEVERVINLPYSSEALYSLVQGYCPASYFPVLEEKMDVYSSLKVFITRRRGRRYFCCSGCSSSSPHGMGDIRKHILGVHAKVPERYKAAAMHCSRLSREDNTLLPNHVLLHLAKMKWKGTVIKPLAEMDLSQFGTRRASAVGLARPSGQFASQVYQPSTQHRDTEKLTALSATASLATGSKFHAAGSSVNKSANPSQNSNSSPLLDDLSSSVFHMEDSVDDLNVLSASEEPYVIRISMNQCAPLSSDKDADLNGYLYVCSLCQYASGYVGATRAHVIRVHASSVAAYQCPHCEITYNTRKDAMTHHQASHSGLEFSIGHHLPAHRAAMLRVRIRDVDQEPAVVAASLKTLVREGKLGPNVHQHSDDLDSPEAVGLFEEEMEEEDGLSEDGMNSISALADKSVDEPRARKIARHDLDDSIRSTRTTRSLSNGEIGRSHEADTSARNGESTLFGANPAPRITLSGSSRRKPSKLQLVQLKPATTPVNTEHDTDEDNILCTRAKSVIANPSKKRRLSRSQSSSPEPLSDKLMVDISSNTMT